MRIKKLTLCNFKSYKGTLVVDFGDNSFSAIIGPNGVGKSNLMDAISFVFGSSLTELRTRTFRDLVYRDSEDGATADTSYVAAEFDKVTFKREISGTQCVFKIGRRNVDKETYLDQLEEIGISKNSNSMVFQGSIERMANLSPRELADLFEEMSGSIELKREYDIKSTDFDEKRHQATSIGKLRATQLAEVKRINSTIESTRKRARNLEKIKKAEQLELDLRAASILCRIEECKHKTTSLKREKRSLAKNLAASTAAGQEVKTKLVNAVRELQELEENQRNLELSTNSAIATIHASRTRVTNGRHRIEALEPQLRCLQGEAQVHAEQLERCETVLTNATNVFERNIGSVTSYSGDMDLYAKCLYDFEVETALDQDKIGKIRRNMGALQTDLRGIDKLSESMSSRVHSLKQQHSIAKLKDQEQHDLIARYHRQKQDCLSEHSSLKQEHEEFKRAKDEKNLVIADLAQQIKGMLGKKRDADSRNSLLERVQKLKRKVPGVIGLLYTLVQPKEERFASAIDLILGANFSAVVVNTISTAKKCISVCQDQNLGVMTFLPLDGLHLRNVDSRLRSINGARLAIDAVQFERDYAAAIQYACSDTLLCDSSELAFDLFDRYHVKTVSVDGTVLNTNSVVTAGNYESNRFDKLRSSTLRAKLSELVEELKALRLNSLAIGDKVIEVERKLQMIDDAVALVEQERSLTSATLNAYSEDLDSATRNMQDVQVRREGVLSEIEAQKAELEDVELGFSGLKRRVFEPFTATCDTDIHTFQKAFEKRKELESAWELQRQTFKKDYDFAKRKLTSSTSQVKELEELIENLKNAVAENEPKIAESQKLREQNSVELKLSADQVIEYEAKIDGLNTELKSLQEGELDHTDEVDELNSQLDRIKQTQEGLIQRFDLFEGADEEEAYALSAKLETNDAVQDAIEVARAQLRELQTETEQLSDTADDNAEEAQERLDDLSEQLKEARAASTAAERALAAVKESRREIFMDVFEPVANALASIYKELTVTEIDPLGGAAALRLSNSSQPWVGAKFTAMPPRKPFAHISELSGGEKTIAALALIFALNNTRASPIYVLDEVDAALDYSNVHLVAKYIQKCAEQGTQFVVISLKLWFFEHADNLLGVYRVKDEQGSKLMSYALA